MKKHLKRKNLRFIAISGWLILLTATTNYAQEKEIIVDRIIVKVDNYIVLKSDLERTYLEYLSQGEVNSGSLRCKALENLVINKMLVAKAEIDSIVVSDGAVQNNLDQRMSYMISQIGSPKEIEAYYGKSLEQIEAELFDQVKEQQIIEEMQRTITADIKVTPSEVKQFFNSIPNDSLPYFSTEVEVGQLVMKPEPGQEQRAKVERQLLEIRGQILRGSAKFENLAKLYSEDPGSGSRGGELPFYKRGELAPEFEESAMTMEVGELSMPIKTDFGYHLIELQERRGNTFKTRHILITPKPSVDDIANAALKLDSIRNLILDSVMDFRSAAKEFSADNETAMNGGFFSGQDGSTRVSVEVLDPNIFFTVDTMKIGAITEPLKFSMPDGSTAFRLIYYLQRVPPHQANLKDDYQKLAQYALNEKKGRLLDEWFKRAKDEVYVDLDPSYNYCNILK
jgi:peptidyl-prolyl cis-trans isomerase SurA